MWRAEERFEKLTGLRIAGEKDIAADLQPGRDDQAFDQRLDHGIACDVVAVAIQNVRLQLAAERVFLRTAVGDHRNVRGASSDIQA